MIEQMYETCAKLNTCERELYHLQENLIDEKLKYAQKKNDVLLNTDFKEVGLTNEKQRNAYVEQATMDLKERVSFFELKVEHQKRVYEMLKYHLRILETEARYVQKDP